MTANHVLGIGVGSGVAIGRAHLLAASELEIRRYPIERKDVVHEVARLTRAFAAVRAELEELRSQVTLDAPQEVRAFLDLHRMILNDATLAEAPRDLVRSRLINAEWALSIQLEEVCKQFDAIDDAYFRERSQDVRQVVDRVMHRLVGANPNPAVATSSAGRRAAGSAAIGADEKAILIAQDVAPADMLHLRQQIGRAHV